MSQFRVHRDITIRNSEPLIHRATVRCCQLMALEPGARLGPYEIVELRGKGGMGEVYLGRDTRLERDVAIKVLPEELGQDTLYRQRLEREAKSLSQLSHPHICTLHDIGSEDGVDYLVMEYLAGETLEERLQREPLPMEDLLGIGGEIAEALDAAHRHNVIHRDLKPSNVMLTATGAKVLDFGLAIEREQRSLPGSDSHSPTRTRPLTRDGSIVGTLHYMAPEQLEGKEVDARTDLFALGAVLYEMATGRRAFGGDSAAGVIGAVLHVDPTALCALRRDAPEELESLVGRCLNKQPDARVSSAAEVLQELKSVSATSPGGARGSDGEDRPPIDRRVVFCGELR